LKPLKGNRYFFKHEQMDFEVLCALGGCYYGNADAGEVLSTAARVRDGDFESWFREWNATAERVRAAAAASAAEGNRVSARRAFLRAGSYFSLAAAMVDGTDDPSRLVPAWSAHRDCWREFCSRLEPPAEEVEIPYEGTRLPGHFFRPDPSPEPRAVIVFNNGSDGSLCGMWASGVAAALERGYAALTFDGPGQNSLLWLQGIPFRPDWENVITPVVDYVCGRPDVDGNRIALSGISQGGYWILRALAFEHRPAAGIADPGVMDVSTAMLAKLPGFMRKHLETGEEGKFNREMAWTARLLGKSVRQSLAFRMKPYATDNYYEWIRAARRFNLRGVIQHIRCPVFIADPENEQFWPGQPRRVFEALECPKTIVRFTAAEGADRHCQPLARGLYDQRMFDWLAGVMPAR